jgi:hypothetical protein
VKIHSNILTHDHFADAVRHASRQGQGTVWTEREDESGSRSHARKFDVVLVSDGTVNRRRTQGGEGFSATWDQWGHFLSALYAVDPDAKAGPYANVEDFDRKTDGKYSSANA